MSVACETFLCSPRCQERQAFFESCDGLLVRACASVARHSVLCNIFLEDMDDTARDADSHLGSTDAQGGRTNLHVVDGASSAVRLPIVAPILKNLFGFCQHLVLNTAPNGLEKKLAASSTEMDAPAYKALFSPRCVHFVEALSHRDLCSTLLAADYLDIRVLVKLCASQLVCSMQGHTPDALRARFGIRDAFSTEDDARARREFSWCCAPTGSFL